MQKRTLNSLAERYPDPVPLMDIAGEFLGIKTRGTISRMAANGELPFPVFRLRDSTKAPWLVRLADLAELIDRRGK